MTWVTPSPLSMTVPVSVRQNHRTTELREAAGLLETALALVDESLPNCREVAVRSHLIRVGHIEQAVAVPVSPIGEAAASVLVLQASNARCVSATRKGRHTKVAI